MRRQAAEWGNIFAKKKILKRTYIQNIELYIKKKKEKGI